MLLADKCALERNLKVNLLSIREKELNYYTQNCLSVGTQAALLAGFAYQGLTQVAIPHERAYLLKLAYILVTTVAMCLELIAVLNTTLLSMMGPGLALRGPDGSMGPAVDGMMTEYRTAYSCFVLGLICFHFSAALFSWLIYVHWAVSTVVTLTIFFSLSVLLRYAKRVYIRFRLPPEEVVTGQFHADEVAAAARGAAASSAPSSTAASQQGLPANGRAFAAVAGLDQMR